MGIAEVYKVYVDADMDLDQDEVGDWFREGLDAFVEARVAQLVMRWKLMNVYVAGGMEREETAKVCRQVARNSCSWLMKIMGMEAYDWTYLNGSDLMPDKESEEYRQIAHAAASLDISAWLGRWREECLARMSWYCTMADRALDAGVPQKTAARKLTNRVAHALNREIDGVLHALHQDNAKPKRRQKGVAEEE